MASCAAQGAPSGWTLSPVTQPLLSLVTPGFLEEHSVLVLSLPKSWNQPFLQGALVPFHEKCYLAATVLGLGDRGKWQDLKEESLSWAAPELGDLEQVPPLPLGLRIRGPV